MIFLDLSNFGATFNYIFMLREARGLETAVTATVLNFVLKGKWECIPMK